MKNGNMPAMQMNDISWFEGKDEELQELTFKLFGGLTKREYFAAMAMQGIITHTTMSPDLAHAADELLKALEDNNGR